ncbi:hypothetical protein QUF90_08360 [Desulfococcaceae bacterium HSG9]|nr:hypothetical protein [Desulfococcaceae bacterium HSG9]
MAKLYQEPIKKHDIEEYLDQYSDFSFELKVLNLLNQMGFECEHSGIYEDPITKKTREFDIRATKSFGFRHVKLSVECKNFRENFPLVAHCCKRKQDESYHNVLVNKHVDKNKSILTGKDPSSIMKRLSSPHSLYKKDEFVAKSIDQVGRTANGITSNDGSVFEKINQAIHSAYDLIAKAHYKDQGIDGKVELVLPVLVIPDDRLWVVKYDQEGNMLGNIELCNHLTQYVGQKWKVGYVGDNYLFNDFAWYTLSHLEIITVSSLKSILENYFGCDEGVNNSFSQYSAIELYDLKV